MVNEEYQKMYMLVKLDCDCGGKYARCNLSKHKQTKKHKEWVLSVGGAITKEKYVELRQHLSLRRYEKEDEIFQQDKKTSV